MKLSNLLSVATFALASSPVLALPADAKADAAQYENIITRAQKAKEASLKLSARDGASVCSWNNIAVRQEFSSLSKTQRKAYTDAVLCLQARTANTPSALVPGAKSRYDDFVGTHINQTLNIHYTGTFLAWHRLFTWEYEQALRNECGYQGYQPYWDWPRYVAAPQNSPIFNGDAYSMSGNGAPIPNHPGLTLGLVVDGVVQDPIYLQPGLGGGCVTSGPFANMAVNLGPVALSGSTEVGPMGGLGYNPRCLKRDIGPSTATRFTNYTAVTHLLAANNDIWGFEMEMQGIPGSGVIGVHGGGHYTIAGDPGGDLFVSPGDPAFYLHHSQIDRMWTIWQDLDPVHRQFAISGTGTFLNEPPSANTTLDTPINLGYAASGAFTMRDLMSTTGGPFCYTYL